MPVLHVPMMQTGTWPAQPPAFMRVEPAASLLVPLAGGRQGQVIAVRPGGTRVRIGEMLTETAPEVGHIPVAPIAGTLANAQQVILVGGAHVPAVTLYQTATPSQVDKLVTSSAAPTADRPYADRLDLTREDLPRFIDHLRRGGIQADRRTSPDLIAQLLMVLRRPVDTVLCNLLDADPPLRLLANIAVHAPRELVHAVAALRGVCGASSAAIVIDDTTPGSWMTELRAAARSARVRIISLTNDYPQFDPTMLVHRLFQRRLRPNRLPVEQGVVLLDAAAAVAVGQWLIDGQPMSTVPVGIFDHVHGEHHYAHVPLGTTVDTLLTALEVDIQHTTLRTGQLLRDLPVAGDHVLAGGELILHVLPLESRPAVDPCIRCGWCTQGCPTRIQPAGLLDAAQREDLAMADHYGLESCIECGICMWVCPSYLPLLEGIRALKEMRTAK